MREMEAKWLDFMENSRGSNSGKGLCIEFLGLIVPLSTRGNNTLQYLSQLAVTIPYNIYLTQLEVKAIPLSTQ